MENSQRPSKETLSETTQRRENREGVRKEATSFCEWSAHGHHAHAMMGQRTLPISLQGSMVTAMNPAEDASRQERMQLLQGDHDAWEETGGRIDQDVESLAWWAEQLAEMMQARARHATERLEHPQV